MTRQAQEEVAAAAQRRLELLGRELEQAGLRRVDPEDDADRIRLPEPVAALRPGRHVRPARPRDGSRWGGRVAGWLGDRLPETLRGRTSLETGPVVLVVGLVALAVTAATVVVLRMGGDTEVLAPPAPSGTVSALVPERQPGAVASAGAPAGVVTGAGVTGTVTVDVAGRVRRPGVATLPAGSRVVDALRKAGGPRGRVDLSTLNLARILVDGEQILVGRGAAPTGTAVSGGASPGAAGALVNINTATAEQLDTLPGVGPVTASKILDWRTAHGAFSSVEELLEVDGIGEKTLADLAPHVTV